MPDPVYEDRLVARLINRVMQRGKKTIAREHVYLTARTLPEQQALRYASVRASGMDMALSVAAQGVDETPVSKRRAWDALIRSRALVLDEMASRHRTMSAAGDPDTARLVKDLASARRRLANLTIRGLSDLSPERYRGLLDEAPSSALTAHVNTKTGRKTQTQFDLVQHFVFVSFCLHPDHTLVKGSTGFKIEGMEITAATKGTDVLIWY